jgi:hypothetical protein
MVTLNGGGTTIVAEALPRLSRLIRTAWGTADVRWVVDRIYNETGRLRHCSGTAAIVAHHAFSVADPKRHRFCSTVHGEWYYGRLRPERARQRSRAARPRVISIRIRIRIPR